MPLVSSHRTQRPRRVLDPDAAGLSYQSYIPLTACLWLPCSGHGAFWTLTPLAFQTYYPGRCTWLLWLALAQTSLRDSLEHQHYRSGAARFCRVFELVAASTAGKASEDTMAVVYGTRCYRHGRQGVARLHRFIACGRYQVKETKS